MPEKNIKRRDRKRKKKEKIRNYLLREKIKMN